MHFFFFFFLTLFGFPRLTRIRRMLCFPVTVLSVEPRRLLFLFHIWMRSAGWVARWRCAWLPCCMPGPGCTLVPMPFHPLIPWLTLHAACPSSWVQRSCSFTLQIFYPGESGEERGKGDGIHFVFVYLDFESENTPHIPSYLKVFIAQLKSFLYLVKYTSVKLGAGEE